MASRVIARAWHKLSAPRMHSALDLTEAEFFLQFALPDVVRLTNQKDIPRAKEALIKHFDHRPASSWPNFPPQTHYKGRRFDQYSHQELLAQAELILEHHLGLQGLPEIDLGNTIDWSYDPTPDPRQRWRRDLHRHRWWAVLALAYDQTGDERYAAEFATLVVDWVEKNPPPPHKDESNAVWGLMQVGMRCTVWPTVFATFCLSPAFHTQAKLKMLRSLYDHGRFLSLFKTDNNHLLRESNGLAYLSLYFPEFEAAAEWQRIALARLDQALEKQVNADGSHFEYSTGYQWLAVEEFQTTYALLQSHGLSLPTQDFRNILIKMYRWLANITRPDGTFPQINDGVMSDKETLLAIIARAGETFDRNDLLYIGTRGKLGQPPSTTSVGLDNAGLFAMRSDWSAEARYLLFDAGPYGGHHGHEDKLSVEVYAFGQPFIVDPGSYTYNRTDPFRLYFVGSQGHNTVLIDEKSQIRRWHSQHQRARRTAGGHATWISQPAFDYARATYQEGYGAFRLKRPRDATIIDDVTHTRHILFIKPDYWIILDELQATRAHNYQLLFHTMPEVNVHKKSQNRVVLSTSSESPRLYLIPAEPQTIQVDLISGEENSIQGWYSAGFADKVPTTTVRFEQKNRSNSQIATLLYPCPPSPNDNTASILPEQQNVQIEPLPMSGGDTSAYAVTHAAGTDYVLFSLNDSPVDSVKQFGPFKSRASVAAVRTDRQGNVLSKFESCQPQERD